MYITVVDLALFIIEFEKKRQVPHTSISRKKSKQEEKKTWIKTNDNKNSERKRERERNLIEQIDNNK
jgi:hypothetical protein